MKHASFDETAEPIALTLSVRETLEGIVSGLDARFMQVGTTLEKAVLTIDHVVQGLAEVVHIFEAGDAGAAVADLTKVAHRLSAVPEQQERRSAEIGTVRKIADDLGRHVADVSKALDVLQIYGVNVKIAASGAADFVDFAERMRNQLLAGGEQIKGFETKLADLEEGLSGMEVSDQLLIRESAKVVPAVPARLIEDASGLRERQANLATLAAEVRQIAQAIQGNVASVLGAIQVGDIARQRLEHVLQGCAQLDAQLALSAPGRTTDGLRHHLLMLFSAQLLDTAEQFRGEAAQLIASLRKIGPQTSQLLAFGKGDDSLEDSRHYLRRVETGIAEADAMTLRLRNADAQAENMVSLILQTVDDLTARARMVKNLRIDVQQMAINIGLRCRRVEAIGRPVVVIANEIRSYSDKLDVTTTGIVEAAGELGAVSLAMRERSNEERFDTGEALARSLAAIGEGAERTERAMAAAGDEAGEIVGMLQDTGEQLGSSLTLAETIETLGLTLHGLAGSGAALSPEEDSAARELLAAAARSYTMAREREVHGQFLLPGMEPISGAPSQAGISNDDDDLFDAALF